MEENSIPEMLRTNLESVIITMLKINITDILHFDYMDSPSPNAVMRAVENLMYLDCLNEDFELTKMGNDICEFPLEPHHAVTLVHSVKCGIADSMCKVISLMTLSSIFIRPKESQRHN